ncbi:MAG: hypothetical protein WA081_12605 [Desulfosalsimonadaceae bacterium]
MKKHEDHSFPDSNTGDGKGMVMQLIMDVGPGFHPDTDAVEYIDVATGEPLFSEKQAQEINECMDTVFKLLPDPYEIGFPVVLNMLEKRSTDKYSPLI